MGVSPRPQLGSTFPRSRSIGGAAVRSGDQAVTAMRLGFASALGDLFLLTALLLAVPMVASLLLTEVPLRGRSAQTSGPPHE